MAIVYSARRSDKGLIKNSGDATRRMKSITNAEHYMAYIAIDVSTDNRVLTITDNGIGMNEHEIEYYLTKLGSSFYSSPEFGHNFVPLSDLGIGILSTFMLAQKVEVETYKQ